VLLKLRSDLIESLTNSKLNKFSLMMRLTFNGTKLALPDILDPESVPSESTALRDDFEAYSNSQVSETPMMAATLHPPGQLIHLHRLSHGAYEPRLIQANELMERGMMIQSGFFTDHFPDKVVSVLSDLAATESSSTLLSISSLSTAADSIEPSTVVEELIRRSSTATKMSEENFTNV
jgi:sn1-specific diacylglycerol lipase